MILFMRSVFLLKINPIQRQKNNSTIMNFTEFICKYIYQNGKKILICKLENFNTSEDSKYQKYLKASQTAYDQILNKDKNLEKQNHFWSNLWRPLPSYKTGFMIALFITMDGLFLSLLLALFLVFIKTILEQSQNFHKMVFYSQKNLLSFNRFFHEYF